MCKRKQPKPGGSNREKKTNSKDSLKNNMCNLTTYLSPQTEIWWVWTVLWLPSGTNSEERHSSPWASLQAAFLEAQNIRQSEVGNIRVRHNLANDPMDWPQLHKSCMAQKVCKTHQTVWWLLEDSVLKVEHLGFQGQAWAHSKLEQSKTNSLVLIQPAYRKLTEKKKMCVNRQKEKVTSGCLAKKASPRFLKQNLWSSAYAFYVFIYSSIYLPTHLKRILRDCPNLVFSLYLDVAEVN